ncbi:MAG: hypothetical protein E6J90_36185 [Deltaproteobacteria bacterium]|nr:MAG: hypothetical protein E6J90_36185 [Deltaproteobacteria bacterium]TMQ14505.1 MAG: hypothetical protein E6J91_15120 [Deltaproteobacteria bacterium]
MKKQGRKLSFHRETVRELTTNEVQQVQGGAETRAWSNCNYGCAGWTDDSMDGKCIVVKQTM